MVETLAAVAAGLLVLTAAIHSLLGERRLIGPLMRERTGVLASAQSRFLVRFTWHLGSALSLALAAILLAAVWRPETVLRVILAATGGSAWRTRPSMTSGVAVTWKQRRPSGRGEWSSVAADWPVASTVVNRRRNVVNRSAE